MTSLPDIMTAENGFSEQAVYTGDYLNQTEAWLQKYGH